MSRLAALVTAAALALGAVASADPAAALLLDPSPPILTVSLTCADGGGATLHVQGAELFADRDVRVGRNEPGFQTYATGHTDTHGEFQATGFIPAHPVGFYDLTMQEADGPPDDLTWVDQDTASIYLQCPGVRVLPGQVAQRTGGLQLRVGAQGFYGYGSDVTFRLDGLPLGDPQPAATTGQVFETVTLPALPDCGSHVVTAEQPAYYYYADAISATTTFVVTCPTLTPDPSSVEKASLPRPVHVTGTGWDPGLDVQLAVDGVPGPIVHVDAGGALAGDVTLPVRPCGPVPVTGVQVWPPPITRATRVLVDSVTQPARAQTSVTVTCPAPVTPTPTVTPTPVDPPTPVDIPTPVSTPTPTPTETPTEVPPTASALLTIDLVLPSGGVGTAHGEGFAPGRLVTLRWVLPDGSTAPGTSSAVPDGAGRFAVPCLVLSHARLGPRSLQAVQPAPGGTRAATAATLVVNGPMEPGRSRLLGRR